MNDISLLISPALRPWLLAVFIVLFLVVGKAMQSITASVKPKPIWLEFPWTKKGADEILDEWKKDATAAGKVRKSLALDFLFIVAYVGVIIIIGAMASGAHWIAHWVGAAITWAAITAGVLDVIENFGQFVMLAGQRGLWPLFTSVCASVKFLLVFIAAPYALLFLVPAVIRHFRHQP